MSATYFKTRLRRLLGDRAYRHVTQLPRIMNFLIRPRYESETQALSYLIKPEAICFDIGANYGQYTRLLSPLAAQVYAFEPSNATCGTLRFFQHILRWGNVHIEQCALADVPGELTLHTPIKEHGGLGIALAHLGESPNRQTIAERVPVKTLDGFLEAHAIKGCDFIKCDVEGAEFLVLKGGLQTLERYRPVMLLEIDSGYLARHGHNVAMIEQLLQALDYKFYLWENTKLVAREKLTDRRNNIVAPSGMELTTAHI